jgi:hypothetical protein
MYQYSNQSLATSGLQRSYYCMTSSASSFQLPLHADDVITNQQPAAAIGG